MGNHTPVKPAKAVKLASHPKRDPKTTFDWSKAIAMANATKNARVVFKDGKVVKPEIPATPAKAWHDRIIVQKPLLGDDGKPNGQFDPVLPDTSFQQADYLKLLKTKQRPLFNFKDGVAVVIGGGKLNSSRKNREMALLMTALNGRVWSEHVQA